MKRPRHGELTGSIAFRQNWRGKLILRVEVWDSQWLGYEVVWFKRWRDAKLHDIKTGSYYGHTGAQVFLRMPDNFKEPTEPERSDG